MKAVVFGAGGMLGIALLVELERRGIEAVPWPHAIVDVADPKDVDGALTTSGVDVVFNAAGILNTSHDAIGMVRANALGPHVLAAATKVRRIPLVHISTDCVFSGRYGGRPEGYLTSFIPDPADFYGRTKLTGEVEADHVTIVRTSFVGPDHGLWPWLIEQAEARARIEGWTKARWSGSTVWAVAKGLVDLAIPTLNVAAPPGGIVHLATEKSISKYDALETLDGCLELRVELIEDHHIFIDRALYPTHILQPFFDAMNERPR